MQDPFYNTTLALAGMIQTVSLVKELAQTGQIDEDAYQASIKSIFETHPSDIPSVYGGANGVKLGLEKIIQIFSPRARAPKPLTRYALSLLHIQKKVSRSPSILERLTNRIQKIKKQADYFHTTHPTVIGNLADTYIETISLFHFKIIIWGNQKTLSISSNIDKIRALLLAGIRSAVLWRQAGGSRLHFLFARSKIKSNAEKILAEITRAEVK